MFDNRSFERLSFFGACEVYASVRIFAHVNAIKGAVMLGHCEAKYGLIVFDDVSSLARVKRCFCEVVNVWLDWHWQATATAIFAHQ